MRAAWSSSVMSIIAIVNATVSLVIFSGSCTGILNRVVKKKNITSFFINRNVKIENTNAMKIKREIFITELNRNVININTIKQKDLDMQVET